ncbi:MAG: NUDIX hydrolase [Opitutales bacterium]
MAEEDKEGAGPSRWDLIQDTKLHDCYVWDLRTRRYRHPLTRQEGDFYYLDSKDWAIIVARTTDGQLVLVRQFRWGADTLCWEFPGGVVDPGEDPVTAGLRELREETGYVGTSGRCIGSCYPNPAILNNRCHIIFADNVRLDDAGTSWDEHEELEVRVLPEAEVYAWARESKLDHALALVGLLYYGLNVE